MNTEKKKIKNVVNFDLSILIFTHTKCIVLFTHVVKFDIRILNKVNCTNCIFVFCLVVLSLANFMLEYQHVYVEV